MFLFCRGTDANFILLVATALIPICMLVIPFCQILGTLGFVLAIMGFNMGCIDCLANLKMIQIYGQAVAPFLQVSSPVGNKGDSRVQINAKFKCSNKYHPPPRG